MLRNRSSGAVRKESDPVVYHLRFSVHNQPRDENKDGDKTQTSDNTARKSVFCLPLQLILLIHILDI